MKKSTVVGVLNSIASHADDFASAKFVCDKKRSVFTRAMLGKENKKKVKKKSDLLKESSQQPPTFPMSFSLSFSLFLSLSLSLFQSLLYFT